MYFTHLQKHYFFQTFLEQKQPDETKVKDICFNKIEIHMRKKKAHKKRKLF